ncbi:hypothetical protein EVAR_71704_1 [Eumeta japonica]|uniref:Uncharacterized protein n=1 Tax=Eumeta variegata TaxID=151549 RepID=A0A4C1T0R2_EUMVA|nr:hypothetical protein EVAR_71704_1 [Eumeta japonica]
MSWWTGHLERMDEKRLTKNYRANAFDRSIDKVHTTTFYADQIGVTLNKGPNPKLAKPMSLHETIGGWRSEFQHSRLSRPLTKYFPQFYTRLSQFKALYKRSGSPTSAVTDPKRRRRGLGRETRRRRVAHADDKLIFTPLNRSRRDLVPVKSYCIHAVEQVFFIIYTTRARINFLEDPVPRALHLDLETISLSFEITVRDGPLSPGKRHRRMKKNQRNENVGRLISSVGTARVKRTR